MRGGAGACVGTSIAGEHGLFDLPFVYSIVNIFSSLSLAALLLLSQDQRPPDQQPGSGGSAFDVDINGNVYVLNPSRNTLQLFDRAGQLVREIGGPGWHDSEFDRPSGVWARNGIDVFVADYGNHRIQRFDRTLTFVSSFSTRDNDNPRERFGFPTDVALSRQGELYLCDSENGRIVKVDRFTQVERVFGDFGGGKGRLTSPSRLAVGPADAVYVIDGDRVVVYDPFGNYERDLLQGVLHHPEALFAGSDMIIVADEGTLYFLDGNERPTDAIQVKSLLPQAQDIRSLNFTDGLLRLLTPNGIIAVPDPRRK
jgi:DNA-binding beta-propeller fold protein YncE